MAKLRLSSREVERFLEKNGFLRLRVKGSHAQCVGHVGGKKRYVTFPVGKRVILPGTLSSIIRQSGIPRRVWEGGKR